MNRGRKLFGIVVTPSERYDCPYTNKVFVLEGGNGIPNVFCVLQDAFAPVPEAFGGIDGKNEFDLMADIKNRARKRQKPLEVGDWISWFYSGSENIAEFRREHRLHEMRCGNPHFQFLLECVKSPTAICLFNHTFGYVKISPDEAYKLLPDIAFTAWVNVYLDDTDTKLIVEFASFVTSDYKMQIRVMDTPWKEYHKVDLAELDRLDEEGWGVQIVKVVKKKDKGKDLENNVYDAYGYYVGERSLYVEEHPGKYYLVPYIDPNLFSPGMKYRFDAYWNAPMEKFIVFGAEKLNDVPPLPITKEPGEKMMVTETVGQRDDYVMMFTTEKHNYGAMDDPKGLLAAHHITRYAHSKIKVSFYEDMDCTFGRFRIESVDPDKERKIQKNLRDNPLVTGIKGVVISAEGRVFSAAHSTLRIWLPLGTSLPIGTHLVFAATVDPDTFELTANAETMKVFDEPPLEYFEHNGRLVFKTPAERTARGDKICGVVSPHFSLLDDPLFVVPNEHGKSPRMTLWVAESGLDEAGERRVAQTPFFVVSPKTAMPILVKAKFIDKAGRDIGGWVRQRDGSLKGMEVMVADTRPIAGKFSKPGGGGILSKFSKPGKPVRAGPSALPQSSLSSTPRRDVCGCSTGKCKAKQIIMDLMNDTRFRDMVQKYPDTLDKVLACIF